MVSQTQTDTRTGSIRTFRNQAAQFAPTLVLPHAVSGLVSDMPTVGTLTQDSYGTAVGGNADFSIAYLSGASQVALGTSSAAAAALADLKFTPVKEGKWYTKGEANSSMSRENSKYQFAPRLTTNQTITNDFHANDFDNHFQGIMSLCWGFGVYCWDRIEFYQGGDGTQPIDTIYSDELMMRLMLFQDEANLSELAGMVGMTNFRNRLGIDGGTAKSDMPNYRGQNLERPEGVALHREFKVPIPTFWAQGNNSALNLNDVAGQLQVRVHWRDAEELYGFAGAAPTIDMWSESSTRPLADGGKCIGNYNQAGGSGSNTNGLGLRASRILGPSIGAMGACVPERHGPYHSQSRVIVGGDDKGDKSKCIKFSQVPYFTSEQTVMNNRQYSDWVAANKIDVGGGVRYMKVVLVHLDNIIIKRSTRYSLNKTGGRTHPWEAVGVDNSGERRIQDLRVEQSKAQANGKVDDPVFSLSMQNVTELTPRFFVRCHRRELIDAAYRKSSGRFSHLCCIAKSLAAGKQKLLCCIQDPDQWDQSQFENCRFSHVPLVDMQMVASNQIIASSQREDETKKEAFLSQSFLNQAALSMQTQDIHEQVGNPKRIGSRITGDMRTPRCTTRRARRCKTRRPCRTPSTTTRRRSTC